VLNFAIILLVGAKLICGNARGTITLNRVLAIILAGGAGARLKPLTDGRSKPAVPFAGKFRLIDFTLSNCINSGIRQIFILVQYISWSLQRHIQEGWDISGSRLGEYIYCIPAQQKSAIDRYQGTADAVRQNLDLLRRRGVEHVLILSGDHVYKMNYMQMLDYHRKQNAGLTVSATKVRREKAANNLGVFEVDENFKAVRFEEKPAQPSPIPGNPEYALASMGVYIFNTEVLLEALHEGGEDFGRDIIPVMTEKRNDICIYDFTDKNKIQDYIVQVQDGMRNKVLVERTRDSSYWRDVGSIDSYYEANMDLVNIEPLFNLYGEEWVFRTYDRSLPPSKYAIGGKALDSIVSDGCIISGGLVQRSVLSPGVIVEKDAIIEDSVIFDDVIIEPGVRIKRAIIDKEARIRAGMSLGYDLEADARRGCTVSEKGITTVPKRMDAGPV